MKKLLVYLDDDLHEDLKELAHRKKTSMAALVRHALDATFEDDLDSIVAERALEIAARDPSGTTSWEDYKAERARRVRASA
jgi:hypothetical protein